MCVQCACSCLHTCAHVQGVGLVVVHRAQRSLQGGEASDEASVTAVSNGWSGNSAQENNSMDCVSCLSLGTSFRLRIKQVLVAFWERQRNFGANFWSAKH